MNQEKINLTVNRFSQPFPVTSVCREDIKMHLESGDTTEEEAKAIALSFSDEDMEHLADKIADAIMDTFWIVVEDAIDEKKAAGKENV